MRKISTSDFSCSGHFFDVRDMRVDVELCFDSRMIGQRLKKLRINTSLGTACDTGVTKIMDSVGRVLGHPAREI